MLNNCRSNQEKVSCMLSLDHRGKIWQINDQTRKAEPTIDITDLDRKRQEEVISYIVNIWSFRLESNRNRYRRNSVRSRFQNKMPNHEILEPVYNAVRNRINIKERGFFK